jgi:hypothetical protein
MALGNYTGFRATHVDAVKFGTTAWTEANMSSTTSTLSSTFTTNNATPIIDLVGAPDTVNPTKSYAFAKDFSESGNEISTSEENLLGTNTAGSQNQELTSDPASKISMEFTLVYRNPVPGLLFSSATKCCLIQFDNDESASTGKMNFAYNNIVVTHVGSLTRNSDGLMEQKVKFECTGGGNAGSAITVSQTTPTVTYTKVRYGLDKAEEIRTA